jgi:hypothetical protein
VNELAFAQEVGNAAGFIPSSPHCAPKTIVAMLLSADWESVLVAVDNALNDLLN